MSPPNKPPQSATESPGLEARGQPFLLQVRSRGSEGNTDPPHHTPGLAVVCSPDHNPRSSGHRAWTPGWPQAPEGPLCRGLEPIWNHTTRAWLLRTPANYLTPLASPVLSRTWGTSEISTGFWEEEEH